MDHDVLVDNAAYGASQKQISLTSSSEKAVSRKQLLDVASTLTDFVSLFGTGTAATVFQRRIRPRKVLGLWNTIENELLRHDDFGQIFFTLIRILPSDSIPKFCMTLWAIWKRRNTKHWDNKEDGVHQCIHMGTSVFNAWLLANHELSRTIANPVAVTWTKPPIGFFKCNIDAAFQQEFGTTGFGMCIRDHLGHFLLAKTTTLTPMLGIKEGEAHALLLALKWLDQLGIEYALVETDCKLVVDSIYGNIRDITEFGDLINACKLFISSKPGFSIQFVKRQTNMVVHTLARTAATNAWSHISSTLPICIASVVFNEMR